MLPGKIGSHTINPQPDDLRRDLLAAGLLAIVIVSLFLVTRVPAATGPVLSPEKTVTSSGFVLATLVPIKKAAGSDRYDFRTDAEGNVVCDYAPVCWLEKPETAKAITEDTHIHRKMPNQQGVYMLQYNLPPEPEDEFVMMEVAQAPDKQLWAQTHDVWPIGAIKKVDVSAICDNEKRNYQEIAAIKKKAGTLAEQVKAIVEAKNRRQLSASMSLVVVAMKLHGLTADQYRPLYQIIQDIHKEPGCPLYVQEFLKVVLRRFPDPDAMKQWEDLWKSSK
jgi:hypothetical protein